MNSRIEAISAALGFLLLFGGNAEAQTTQDPSVGKVSAPLAAKSQQDPANAPVISLQDKIDKEKEPLEQADAKNPAPAKLQTAVDPALKQNPEIRLKEHALRTAELELSVTQQQVLGKVTEAYADLQQVKAISDLVVKRLANLRRLALPKGVISELEIGDAEVSVVKYTAEVKSREAALASLCGISAKESLPSSLENALATALKNSPEIRLKTHAIRTAELELQVAQETLLRKIEAAQADYKGTEALLAEVTKRHASLLRMRENKPGEVADLEIGDSAVTVAKYNADLGRKEAALAMLRGSNIPGLPLGEAPPILKTYTISANAETIVKTLLQTYKTSPALRVTAIGQTQIMVYAPPAIQMEIAKYFDENKPRSESMVHFLERGRAEVMAKLLADWFKTDGKDVSAPAFGIDSKHNAIVITGSAQQIAFAKKAIQELDKQTEVISDAENVRKALHTPVGVVFQKISMKDVVESLQEKMRQAGHKDLNLIVQSGGDMEVSVKLGQPVPLSAALQLLEDRYGMHFYFRDYGIVGSSGTMPAGAVLVSDFIRRGPETETKAKSK